MISAAKIESEYGELETYRQSYLERAWDASAFTIPSVLPREGSKDLSFQLPNSSLGARAVTNLSARLNLALFPPNMAFMRYAVEATIRDMMAANGINLSQLDQKLEEAERTILNTFESSNGRQSSFIAIQQLIVAGNVLIYIMPNYSMKIFKLNQYVVKRDCSDNVIKIIIKEEMTANALPPDIREKVMSNRKSKPESSTNGFVKRISNGTDASERDDDDEVVLYTCIHMTKQTGKYEMVQSVDGHKVNESEFEVLPYFPLRWVAIVGEDYGRGHVEECLSDIKGHDSLRRSILDAAKICAKIIGLCRPNGLTKITDVTKAKNGDITSGSLEDVGFLQVNKHPDMNFAMVAADGIKSDIAAAFLLNSSFQRTGERVTATEIRAMSAELENTLGGVYSNLAKEFQLPLIKRYQVQLQADGKLPIFQDDDVRAVVLTGLEALGRESDLARLNSFATTIAQLGPEGLSVMNTGEFVRRAAIAHSIPSEGLVRSEEEMMQKQQQMQMAQVMAAGGESFAQEGGALAAQSLAGQGGVQQ